ncbi:MAG: nitroreductase family protein [Candidatus Krumholzibacteriia bacterium]
MIDRSARPDHPINDAIAARWSPYAFDPRPLNPADLRSLLEAARWAPSSFNEQPWRYLAAMRQHTDAFTKLLSCLVEPNQVWARQASALLLTVASLTFSRTGQPNTMARHDVGLASAQLTVEATGRGLAVHQMGGILPDRARELYGIPAGFEAVTGLAIGYPADPATLPDELRARDTAPRRRRPQAEFVFGDAWGEPAALD